MRQPLPCDFPISAQPLKAPEARHTLAQGISPGTEKQESARAPEGRHIPLALLSYLGSTAFIHRNRRRIQPKTHPCINQPRKDGPPARLWVSVWREMWHWNFSASATQVTRLAATLSRPVALRALRCGGYFVSHKVMPPARQRYSKQVWCRLPDSRPFRIAGKSVAVWRGNSLPCTGSLPIHTDSLGRCTPNGMTCRRDVQPFVTAKGTSHLPLYSRISTVFPVSLAFLSGVTVVA
jgi:hypothetical protein